MTVDKSTKCRAMIQVFDPKNKVQLEVERERDPQTMSTIFWVDTVVEKEND